MLEPPSARHRAKREIRCRRRRNVAARPAQCVRGGAQSNGDPRMTHRRPACRPQRGRRAKHRESKANGRVRPLGSHLTKSAGDKQSVKSAIHPKAHRHSAALGLAFAVSRVCPARIRLESAPAANASMRGRHRRLRRQNAASFLALLVCSAALSIPCVYLPFAAIPFSPLRRSP